MKEKETSNSDFLLEILTNLLAGGFLFLILKNTSLMKLPMQYFNDASMSFYWKLPMGFFLFLFLSYGSSFIIETIIKLFKKDSTLENLERERAREAYEEEQRQEEAKEAEEKRNRERIQEEMRRRNEEARRRNEEARKAQEKIRAEERKKAEEKRKREEEKRVKEEEEKRKEKEKFKSYTYNKSSESIFNESTMNLIFLIKKANSFSEIYNNYNEKDTTDKKKLQQIFRKIIVKIHPDKSESLGISQKILNEITQKFQNLYSQVK